MNIDPDIKEAVNKLNLLQKSKSDNPNTIPADFTIRSIFTLISKGGCEVNQKLLKEAYNDIKMIQLPEDNITDVIRKLILNALIEEDVKRQVLEV
jgi:hypothetical protein